MHFYPNINLHIDSKLYINAWLGPEHHQQFKAVTTNMIKNIRCKTGWEGAKCDACIKLTGCRNGGCASGAPDICVCFDGWKGKLCDQPVCRSAQDLEFHKLAQTKYMLLKSAKAKYTLELKYLFSLKISALPVQGNGTGPIF